MFEQVLKNIDDVPWKEAGCTTELDYTEQTSWLPGFLCESFDFTKVAPGLTTKGLQTLQTRTFVGKEKKSLAYVIAIMNMIRVGQHDVEAVPLLDVGEVLGESAEVLDTIRGLLIKPLAEER